MIIDGLIQCLVFPESFKNQCQKVQGFAVLPVGHVFEIEQQELSNYPNAVVVKTTAQEDKTVLRILMKDKSDGTVEPTLEDAFILATK